jgi:hypothetical protein
MAVRLGIAGWSAKSGGLPEPDAMAAQDRTGTMMSACI